MEQTLPAVLSMAGLLVRVAMGIALFAGALTPREHFARRMLTVVVLLGASIALIFSAGIVFPALTRSQTYAVELVLFSTLLVGCSVAVTHLFDASIWTALFCCSAGYAMQNLASGLGEFIWLLVAGTGTEAALGREAPLSTFALCTWLVTLATYAVAYPLITRRLSKRGLEQVSDRSMIVMMAVVMLMVIGFDLVIKSLCEMGIPVRLALMLRCVHGFICVFSVWMEYELLVNRKLASERDTTERLLAERERQYEQSRESIEAINIKCHDLRHQIRSLASGSSAIDPAALADVAREVDVYDAAVRTGNEALDTILTEKSLVCQREGITLTCVADGAALGFMAPADIYALFGNALDNAIEAVRGAKRQSISLVVRRAMGVVSVSVENYYAPDAQPSFEDGLPQTTKADKANHGFGMRSMRAIAERYGGTLVARAEDGVFHLDIML